nr:type II toxin-antitoxin system RelE/ParE family toxin [uncultured Duganella sp.]
MSTPKAEVRLSANFEGNLEDIETFLVKVGAPKTYHALLDGLLNQVIPNLEDFPAMGVPFIGRQANSVEVRRALDALRAKLPQGVEVRSYSWADYLVLYSWDGKAVNLLSIKHHRQLSFDLNSVWK